jgi:O-antigen ligase
MQAPANRFPTLLFVAALLSPLALLVFPAFDARLLFGGLIFAAILVLAAYYCPAASLAPIVFVPQLKDLAILRPIQSAVDLTLLSLAAASGVIALHFVLGTRRAPVQGAHRFEDSLREIIAFFAFATIVAFSYLYTPAPDYGGTKLLRFVLIGSFFLLAPLYLMVREEDFRHFVIAFLCLAVLQSVALLTQLQSSSQATPNPEDADVTRIGAGWLIGMAILLLLFYRLVDSDLLRKCLIAVTLPCLTAGLIASASRGAVVAVSLALIVCVVKARRGKSKLPVVVVGLLLIVCAGTTYYFLRDKANGKYTGKIDELLDYAQGKSYSDSGRSTAHRLEFYTAAIDEIPERPFLGLGVGGWSIYYWDSDSRQYPHNILLEISVEEGLVGLIAFLAFQAIIYSDASALMRLSGGRFVAFFGIFLFALIAAMFSGDLDDNRAIWLCAGLLLAACQLVRAEALRFAFAPSPYMWEAPPQWNPSFDRPRTIA